MINKPARTLQTLPSLPKRMVIEAEKKAAALAKVPKATAKELMDLFFNG